MSDILCLPLYPSFDTEPLHQLLLFLSPTDPQLATHPCCHNHTNMIPHSSCFGRCPGPEKKKKKTDLLIITLYKIIEIIVNLKQTQIQQLQVQTKIS